MTKRAKSTRTVTATVGCLFMAAGLGACGSDDKQNAAAITPAPGQQNAPSAPVTEVPPTSEAPPASSEPVPAPPGQTANVTAPATNSETAQLNGVQVEATPGADRITFSFTGELPGYDIGYAQMPPRKDGSGEVVPVKGTSGLAVRLQQASGVQLTGGVTKTYTGPDRFTPPNLFHVAEVVKVSDVEQTMLWAVGTKDNAPFRVVPSPTTGRLIIEIG